MKHTKSKAYKTGRCVLVLCLLAVFFLFAAGAYHTANARHVKQKEAIYLPKIEWVRSRMEDEKDWIRHNQGKGGEIYLNIGSAQQPVGDVNPYFACLAAQGFLAGTPSPQDMDSVKRYLQWHAEALMQAEGVIENHRMIDGSLQQTGSYDSIDSYVAVFLSLLCQYGQAGGEVAEIDPEQAVLRLAVQQLNALTENGLTKVKPDKQVFYAMDNTEVLAAYRDLQRFASSPQSEAYFGAQQADWVQLATNAAQACETALAEQMWNKQEERFEVGLGKNSTVLTFDGWDILYPFAVAQIYPTAFALTVRGTNAEALYQKFCTSIAWESMEFGPDEAFSWGVLLHIAATQKDTQRAERYLQTYVQKTTQSRSYPLHTADAGWVAKGCASMEVLYREKMQSSLLQDLWNKEG